MPLQGTQHRSCQDVVVHKQAIGNRLLLLQPVFKINQRTLCGNIHRDLHRRRQARLLQRRCDTTFPVLHIGDALLRFHIADAPAAPVDQVAHRRAGAAVAVIAHRVHPACQDQVVHDHQRTAVKLGEKLLHGRQLLLRQIRAKENHAGRVPDEAHQLAVVHIAGA